MRRSLAYFALVTGALGGLVALVACATSEAEEPEREASVEPSDAGPTTLPEADLPLPDAADEGLRVPPTCSPAGWCATELPYEGLDIKDVWPVGGGAFALAQSTDLGIKFLEWDAALGWNFIDRKVGLTDTTYTQFGVWAPDRDEVFYAIRKQVGTTFGALLVHGTRPVPPETTWSWVSSRIDCALPPTSLTASPVVWGTGRDEVYAAVCGNVYRLNRRALVGDAGDDSGVGNGWDLDYADAKSGFLRWYDVTGTASDDVWFAGVRNGGGNQCVILIRKSADGYTTVLDGVPTAGVGCVASPGVPTLSGSFQQIHAPSKGRLVAAHTVGSQNDLVEIELVDGEVRIATAIPDNMNVTLRSPWGTSTEDLFVIATRKDVGGSMVLQATSVWDGGSFDFSTLAINGTPNTDSLWRLRGTSNQNLWVVGTNRAYYKSTP